MKKGRRKNVIQIRDWFEMSRGEQRGVVVLFSLIVLLVGCNFLMPFFFHPDISFTPGPWIEWNNTEQPSFKHAVPSTTEQDETTGKELSLFRFNPNTISDDEWLRLGLHRGQIKSIRNYLSKGGKFKTKNDLSKMYVIDQTLFERLKPYVDLPQFDDNETNHTTDTVRATFDYPTTPSWKSSTKDDQLIVELNTADTATLKKLRGIGSYLAKKIVEYRERLGGFRSFNQLAEIYRVTPGKADTLSQKMKLDPSHIKRIDMNHVTLDRLKQFPYLTHTQSSALIAYREKHGPFHHVSDMQKCVLIDAPTFAKVQDYFAVE